MKVKLFLISIFAMFLTVAGANAAGPTDLIKQINKDIEKLTSKKNVKLEKIIAVLEDGTDFAVLSNSVLDEYCKNLSPEQCSEIKGVFIELLKSSTSKKLSKYEVEKTEYLNEKIIGSKAIVETNVSADKRSVKINYELQKFGSNWKIVNYIVDDVDTIKNYKKQFRKMFKKNSFEEIVSKLRNKIKNS